WDDGVELPLRVGVEGGHVDDVVEAAAGRRQHRRQVVERQLHLACEVGLGRAVLAAADLAGDEQQVARGDGGRVVVALVERLPGGGEDGVASGHGSVPAGGWEV